MSSSPAEDTLLTFPCLFPIKVMGRAEGDFDALVVDLVRRHVAGLAEQAVRRRPSANGAYVSVTVTIEAQSREQLDAVYRELTAEARVLMVL